mgnify:CR=1 FL=1
MVDKCFMLQIEKKYRIDINQFKKKSFDTTYGLKPVEGSNKLELGQQQVDRRKRKIYLC